MTVATTDGRADGKLEAAPALLEIRGLAVSFGPLQALGGVSLSVREGEVVALAGENGAGKTTLVRCIGGDISPTSGEIRIAGEPVPSEPGALARNGVSVLWQDLALCDNLDIAANLMLGRERRLHLASEVRLHTDAARLLDELGISLPATTRDISTLSGGQRQLVAVARAIARRPRLLLLDEPTASLGVAMARQVEELIGGLRQQGTSVLLACHDMDMMFRLADRIVVLRHGRVVAEVSPAEVHPDDVIALLSGQDADSSARGQLTRLHGLAGRLVSADPSSSLSLILSALGAALGSERLCIHLVAGDRLVCAASLGMSDPLLEAWSDLRLGPAGGPAGLAAARGEPVIAEDVRAGGSWTPFAGVARRAKVASSLSVPVLGPGGLAGVITVLRAMPGKPKRDDLDLVTLYAGYAASAIERDRLLEEVTARNRVLETIREMLETLAGPLPVSQSLRVALQALCGGLQADEAALVTRPADGLAAVRASAGQAAGRRPGEVGVELLATAGGVLQQAGADDVAVHRAGHDGASLLAVPFAAPGGAAALVASWRSGPQPADAAALLEDSARSLQLALEREEASVAHQEALTLRRSQDLQRGFLSRLSHELRTPLTAIRGYASSLLQPDVTWDGESQHRFLRRIAAESARLGRLVDDLLDFSAIESGILRLQRDWCDLPLVLEAAVACLPPDTAPPVKMSCAPDLPVIWADHDRLEQVFVNLLANAVGHNPPGTTVRVSAAAGPEHVEISVADDGTGLSSDVVKAPFERLGAAAGRPRAPVSGSPSPAASWPPMAGRLSSWPSPSAPASGSACPSRPRSGWPAGRPGRSRPWPPPRRGSVPVPNEAATRALVVEDDPNIVDLIRSNLAVRGFDTIVSADGLRALRLLETEAPDIVLLDLMLPEIDGFELCRQIRERSSVAIIVVSARGGERDKVSALNVGADDYMTKPFSIEELLARINATLRRTRPAGAQAAEAAPEVITVADLVIDLSSQQVSRNGVAVHLTPTEFALLRELAINRGKLLSHAHLLRHVWGRGYETETEYVRVYVRRLRAKLETNGTPLIVTQPRAGSRILAD